MDLAQIELIKKAVAEERERRREERRKSLDYNPLFIWCDNGVDARALMREALADPANRGFDIEIIGWTPWDPAAAEAWNEKYARLQREKAAPRKLDTTSVPVVVPRKTVAPAEPEPAPQREGPEVRMRASSTHWMA